MSALAKEKRNRRIIGAIGFWLTIIIFAPIYAFAWIVKYS